MATGERAWRDESWPLTRAYCLGGLRLRERGRVAGVKPPGTAGADPSETGP
jgi:hypothetical protein